MKLENNVVRVIGLKDGNTIAANVDLVSAELHPTGRNTMYWYIFEL